MPSSEASDFIISVNTIDKIGAISDFKILLISEKYPIAVSLSSSLLSA
jgi:hypothetical protein